MICSPRSRGTSPAQERPSAKGNEYANAPASSVLQIQLPELESFLTGEKALPHQTFIDSFPSMCGRRKPADMRRYKEPVSRPQPSARYSCAALATPCSRSACGKKSV